MLNPSRSFVPLLINIKNKNMKSRTHLASPTLEKNQELLPPCHFTILPLFLPSHLTTVPPFATCHITTVQPPWTPPSLPFNLSELATSLPLHISHLASSLPFHLSHLRCSLPSDLSQPTTFPATNRSLQNNVLPLGRQQTCVTNSQAATHVSWLVRWSPQDLGYSQDNQHYSPLFPTSPPSYLSQLAVSLPSHLSDLATSLYSHLSHLPSSLSTPFSLLPSSLLSHLFGLPPFQRQAKYQCSSTM